MNDTGHHCPFLNRADSRCSRHFSLDHLGHAFDYCFGYYEGCSVYAELLAERRFRRARGHDGLADGGADGFIQVTVGGRIAHGAAHPEVISHSPGL